MQDLLQVGVISSTHGIAGEVKVFPTTDDVNRFDYLKDVILDTGREKLISRWQALNILRIWLSLNLRVLIILMM